MEEIDNLIDGPKQRAQALFHGGFNYLERIDNTLKGLDSLHVMLNCAEGDQHIRFTKEWASLIHVLFLELAPKMETELRKEKLNELYAAKAAFRNFMFKVESNEADIPLDHIAKFEDLELDLRVILEDKGLLMPSKKTGAEATYG